MALVGGLIGCGQSSPGEGEAPTELTLFVAASLTDVMGELGSMYEAETGTRLVCNFAGSGALAQQLLAAPRADVFLSASERWMDAVEAGGRLAAGTRTTLLSNQLVVVANPESGYALADPGRLGELPFSHLAIGDPDSVPAGKYARQWLESIPAAGGGTVWEAVSDRVSPAPDVRAALTQVVGRRDVVGIVYETDFQARRAQVRALHTVPAADGPAIRYPVAVIAESPRGAEARRFVRFLGGVEAAEVFARHGFTMVAKAE